MPLATFRARLPEWTLAYSRLDDGILGFCDLERQTIWVDVTLDERTRRTTLMHEIVHALRGDQHSLDPVAEYQVEVEAARMLIPAPALRAALATTLHPEDLADILMVDIDLLRTRLRHLDPDEAALLRRVVIYQLPPDRTTRQCALARWWTYYAQPDPSPCVDGCAGTAPVERPAAPLRLQIVPALVPPAAAAATI